MRRHYLISIVIIFLIINLSLIYANIGEDSDASSTFIWTGPIGGLYLPSSGTIKVLFIFAQFPDDKYDTTNISWVKGQAPANMAGWVDSIWSINPTQGSMTHYFNDMSLNMLKFTGKTVSVITPQTRQWYLANNKTRGDIHKDVALQVEKEFRNNNICRQKKGDS
jgi:hypothetical protein